MLTITYRLKAADSNLERHAPIIFLSKKMTSFPNDDKRNVKTLHLGFLRFHRICNAQESCIADVIHRFDRTEKDRFQAECYNV